MGSYERRGRVTPPEQRDPSVGQSGRETPFRLRADATAETKLKLIARRAKEDPKLKFNALMHHFSEENLEQCFHGLNGSKAVGADGISKEDYGRNLDRNLERLVQQLKQFSYRPQPVRRTLIPKGDGKLRPLGISCFEDKVIQSMAAKILGAIFEQDFMSFSYGFRPGRGCHDAIRSAYQLLYREDVRWVVDLDIRACFDTIDHEWLMRCLEERITDRKFLRLIRRMLKAGVLAEGEFFLSEEGTPQGSIVSPVLSNIFLHYVLDLWFERSLRKELKGRSALRRYADDSVAFFEHEGDARHFVQRLAERFGKFGLSLNETKTRVVPFDRRDRRCGVFDFLGFTFYRGKTRQGRPTVKCKTSNKRLKAKVKRFNEWIRSHRNVYRLSRLWKEASAKLQGHYQYYGVSWNSAQLMRYHWHCQRLLFKWLNRRSQRRSFTYDAWNERLQLFPLPMPAIRVRLF